MSAEDEPQKLEAVQCENIDGYLKVLREWLELAPNEPLWYRGSAAYPHPLRPSLHRHPVKQDFVLLEKQITQWFIQRGIPFHTQVIDGYWERLFFMQHHGFPTRLLDWSENPLVALYFALRDPNANSFENRKYVSIWVLNSIQWNRQASTDTFGILDPSSPYARGYASDTDIIAREFPAAMYGAHNSMRITAQRGVFTVFGSDPRSMDQIFESEPRFIAPALRRIDFDTKLIPYLLNSLSLFGVTPSAVMQDLNYLALEAKEIYGF